MRTGKTEVEKYSPPFTISNKMLKLAASISEKVGALDLCGNYDIKPHLRRSNRIRSIHSSLKIEANSLSLTEVRDVIDGHPVLGDSREIKEVKNAYAAYEKLEVIDPYSIKDLKMIHRMLTEGILKESGRFRRGGEGVFEGDRCIFVAPPPDMVPGLMTDLFRWMKDNHEKIHPLILSSVFHYEFVFIHPFADGNGRMARLWQTVLLSDWKPEFAYIPVESQIEQCQEEYYKAISDCHMQGNSDEFIEFMLERIDAMLEETALQLNDVSAEASEYVKRMLAVMEYDVPYTSSDIMKLLGLKSKETFRKNYMDPAMALGYVEMTIPDKPRSKNQRYVRKRHNKK